MSSSRQPNYLLVFISNSLLFFFAGIAKFIYTPLLSPFKRSLEISSTQAGLLITLVYLGYALTRFPSGILTDIYGCKKTITYTGLFMGLNLLLVGLANNYLVLAFLSFAMGAATGLYTTAGYTFSVLVGKTGRETVFTALMELFGGVAGLLAPLTAVWFLEDWNLTWNSIFITMGLGVLLASILFIILMKGKEIKKESPQQKNKSSLKTQLKTVLRIFKKPSLKKFVLWATIVGGFGCFAIKGFNSFIPTALDEIKGYSFSRANQLFALIAISGLIFKMAIAWMADKFGTRRILAGIYILNIVFFILFTSQTDHLLTIFCLITFGLTFKSHNTLINSYVLKLSPPQYQGTGFGLFSTLYTVIYSIGPLFVGNLSDRFNLVTGMRFSLLGIFIALPLLLLFKKWIDVTQLDT